MDEKDLKILKYCKDGCKSLKPLINIIPRCTLYRHKDKLKTGGLLIGEKGKYKTTNLGLQALLEFESLSDFNWKCLSEVFPAIKYIPTKQQQAVIELHLAAIVARRDEIMIDHHPTFILSGATLKWKTWTAKFICNMLGLNSTKNIILLTSESGRSILTRKGYNGKMLSKRDILNEMFVCFDEFHDADSKTKRLCNVYIQGRKHVPYENKLLEIEPVPLITLNPSDGNSLLEKLRFEEPQIRRSIVCNMDNVIIPSDVKTKGEEILRKVQEYSPIKLPSYKHDCTKYKNRIYKLLIECINKDKMKLVDVEMILMLCTGMTAFLPKEKAVSQVVYNYLMVIETLDWTSDSWQKHFAKFIKDLLHGSDDGLLEQAQSLEVAENSLLSNTPLHIQVKQLLDKSDKGDDFNYDLKLKSLKEQLEGIGISINEVETFVKLHKALQKLEFDQEILILLAGELKKTGLEKKKAVEKIGALLLNYNSLEVAVKATTKKKSDLEKYIKSLKTKSDKLESFIKKVGRTPKKIMQLKAVDDVLRDRGVEPEAVKELVKMLTIELTKTNRNAKECVGNISAYITVFEELENVKNHLKNNINDAELKLKNIEGEQKTIEDALSNLNNRCRASSEQKRQLKNEISLLDCDINKLQAKKKILNTEIANVLETKEDAEEILKKLAKLRKDHEELSNIIRKETIKLEDLSIQHKELEVDIEMINGWNLFLLSGNIPSYEWGFWKDLEKLVQIHKGNAQLPKFNKKQIAEHVREKMVEFYKRMVKEDLAPVSRWELDRFKEDIEKLKEKGKDWVPKQQFEAVMQENKDLKEKIKKLECTEAS